MLRQVVTTEENATILLSSNTAFLRGGLQLTAAGWLAFALVKTDTVQYVQPPQLPIGRDRRGNGEDSTTASRNGAVWSTPLG